MWKSWLALIRAVLQCVFQINVTFVELAIFWFLHVFFFLFTWSVCVTFFSFTANFLSGCHPVWPRPVSADVPLVSFILKQTHLFHQQSSLLHISCPQASYYYFVYSSGPAVHRFPWTYFQELVFILGSLSSISLWMDVFKQCVCGLHLWTAAELISRGLCPHRSFLSCPCGASLGENWLNPLSALLSSILHMSAVVRVLRCDVIRRCAVECQVLCLAGLDWCVTGWETLQGLHCLVWPHIPEC